VVTFTCTVPPGGVANLYILDNFVGNSPYSWNTTTYPNGNYYLLCNGYVNKALVGSAAELVMVSNGARTPTPVPPTPTPKPSTPTPVPPTPTPKPPTPTPTPVPTSTPTPGPVTITSPAAGGTVSGVVIFSCSVPPGDTANLYIDDVLVGYSSYSWNTTTYKNASHYLLCNGYRSGSLVRSAAENVKVSN
jgi:hypothetical protein